MKVRFRKPADGGFLVPEELRAKAPLSRRELGVRVAVPRDVSPGHECDLEPGGYADDVQRYYHVPRSQMCMGIICCGADDQQTRELVLQGDTRQRAIAFLNF